MLSTILVRRRGKSMKLTKHFKTVIHDANFFVATEKIILLLRDANLATTKFLCVLHSPDVFLYIHFEDTPLSNTSQK